MAELIMNKDLGLTVAASIFTSIGLGQNDLVQVIGGMIISPLANPIIESILVGDVMMNMAKLLILVLTCITIGILYFFIYKTDDFEPTERMIGIADLEMRGYMSDIVYGLVVGMVIYFSYGKRNPDDINIITGLAVGITLLPAFVNAGIMFGAGIKGYKNMYQENLSFYGLTSSIVGIIYLVTIAIGFLTAKTVKEYYDTMSKD